MIAIEFEAPNVSLCECCGRETYRLTRFVTKHGCAHAVYFLQFTPGHDQPHIAALVSLGAWGESATSDERLAFPLRIWASGNNYNVGLVDASDSPWFGSLYLGRMLNRCESLRHPWRDEVFHITDHIVREDKEAVAFLTSHPQSSV